MESWKMVTLIERERERERERDELLMFTNYVWLSVCIYICVCVWWSDNWENINLQKEGKKERKEKEKSIVGQ